MSELKMNSEMDRKILFNETGDTDLASRKMIGGNTTNINDFNNVKYQWTNDWYRQAMNNFGSLKRSICRRMCSSIASFAS